MQLLMLFILSHNVIITYNQQNNFSPFLYSFITNPALILKKKRQNPRFNLPLTTPSS